MSKELGTMKEGRLRGRFMWLLEEMCRKSGLDVQLIDPAIDYYENKANIEEEAHKRLFLKPEKRGPEEEEKEVKAYEDVEDEERLRDETCR